MEKPRRQPPRGPDGRPPRHRPPQDKRPQGPRTDWGAVASWYDGLVGEEGSEFQKHVVHPGVLRLLAAQPGERVLDVACGQGVLCRLLQQAGTAPTGIDAAAELVRIARERSDPSIRWHIGDARSMEKVRGLEPATFNAATCVLAIQNIHPFLPVFEGVSRMLVEGGRFVMAMMHPHFRGPKATSWGWDDARGVQYRRIDRYMEPRKEPIITHPGKDPTGYTWTFHRPLQSYVRSLRTAGLWIDAVEEWPSHKVSDSGPRAPAENVARREIPMFLAIRAWKLRGPNVPTATTPPQATTGQA